MWMTRAMCVIHQSRPGRVCTHPPNTVVPRTVINQSVRGIASRGWRARVARHSTTPRATGVSRCIYIYIYLYCVCVSSDDDDDDGDGDDAGDDARVIGLAVARPARLARGRRARDRDDAGDVRDDRGVVVERGDDEKYHGVVGGDARGGGQGGARRRRRQGVEVRAARVGVVTRLVCVCACVRARVGACAGGRVRGARAARIARDAPPRRVARERRRARGRGRGGVRGDRCDRVFSRFS